MTTLVEHSQSLIAYTIWGLIGVAAIVTVLLLLALNGVFD